MPDHGVDLSKSEFDCDLLEDILYVTAANVIEVTVCLICNGLQGLSPSSLEADSNKDLL